MNRVLLVLIILLSFSCFGKNTNEESNKSGFILNETDKSVTYLDKFFTETTISKNPKKVVVCYNSLLGLWYFAGGESITKVKGSINVPEEAKDLIDLGSANSLSIEAIMAMEPELVILAANYESQVAMAPILREMGIEVMIIDTSINSYERFRENALLFSKINGTESLYTGKIEPILKRVDDIVKTANEQKDKPRVAAIFASSKSLSLESDIALTGEMIKKLGGENILKKEDVLTSGETRITFSIEAIISQNPEIIMFSTMGNVKNTKKNIENMIAENPVWNEVDAVKNGRVFFLPKAFSVFKPNQLYDEAFLYIAELMYPGLFGV